MHDDRAPHFVGLDIGTSGVRCVVGVVNDNDAKPSIVGCGSAPNQGMRKGVVVHVDDVADAVVQAVAEAERVSGLHIDRATININGAHIQGIDSRGVIAISTANREITPDDRDRVEDAATVLQLPPNREIVQLFAKNYSLDGQPNIKDPVGMHGVRLEVDTHIATAATPDIHNLDVVMERTNILVDRHTLSSLASAEAVLTRQQREAGTALLDIGAGTINLVVIEDGEIQHIAVLPIGGMYITNDLAIGLKTDLDVADLVKLKHANLASDKKGTVKIEHEGTEYNFKASDVHMVTEARIEEMFEYVDKELQRIHRSRKLPGGVVLTGGTANIPGIAEFAREKLQLPARVGNLQPLTGLIEKVSDPTYFTAVGLMMLDLLLPSDNTNIASGRGIMSSVGSSKLLHKLSDYFGHR